MVNDMSIIFGIISFFIFIAVLVPFFNNSFSDFETTENNPNSLIDDLNPDDAGSRVSAFRIFASVISMFFWSFEIPVWANTIIFLPLRLLLILIIARNIWIGGGA